MVVEDAGGGDWITMEAIRIAVVIKVREGYLCCV